MKFTLYSVVDKYNVLCRLSNKKLPIKIAYTISKNISTFEIETKIINESRIKLAEQYAEKDVNGNPKIENDTYIISEEDKAAFNKELVDYYNTEIEVNMSTFNYNELDKLEDTKYDALSPSDILSLQFMIKETEAEKRG